VACPQAAYQGSVREHLYASSVALLVQVVGQTFQNLENVSPRTYIGSGKTVEVEGAVDELDADTVIFDDELTPGQLRNLERAWGDNIRLCDRTALILDIFSQRAATKEGQLQVCLLDTFSSSSYFHVNHMRILLFIILCCADCQNHVLRRAIKHSQQISSKHRSAATVLGHVGCLMHEAAWCMKLPGAWGCFK